MPVYTFKNVTCFHSEAVEFVYRSDSEGDFANLTIPGEESPPLIGGFAFHESHKNG
jgi:hypothetical protein